MFSKLKKKLKRNPDRAEERNDGSSRSVPVPANSINTTAGPPPPNNSINTAARPPPNSINAAGPQPPNNNITHLPQAFQAQLAQENEEMAKMRRPGESTQESQVRLMNEFVEQWKDHKPEPRAPINTHDRISDLIFNMGQSNQPRTDASGPDATPSDRTTALIEQALENLFRPQAQPTHAIVEVDVATLDKFAYTPLPEKRSIRLLHFHEDEYAFTAGNSGERGGGKQKICSMETFLLDEAPPYLTLSYSWEGPRNSAESLKEYEQSRDWVIREAGDRHCHAVIRRNLYEALTRISTAGLATRYLWTDALCINQKDDDEKGSQVAMMGEIYTLCEKVIIWLGLMDAYEASDIWTIHFQLVPEIPKYIARYGAESIRTGDWTEEDLRERFNISEQALRQKHWKTYKNLFTQMRWFRRSWIVQEVALAPSAAVFFGHMQLAWEEMALLAMFLRKTGLSEDIDFQEDEASDVGVIPGVVLEVFNNLSALAVSMKAEAPETNYTLSRKLGNSSPECNSWGVFLACVNTLRTLDSNDAKDRIYAALGFLHLDKTKEGKIIPNYNKERPAGEIFADVTATILSEVPGLEILALREDSVRSPHWKDLKLPSWAPDFTAPKSTVLVREELDYCPSPPTWDVSGGLLSLEGVFVDQIVDIASWDTTGKNFAPGAQLLDLLRIWLGAVLHLLRATTYDEDPLEVLWRTLIANQCAVENSYEIDASHFKSFMAQTILDTVDGILEDSDGQESIPLGLIEQPYPESDSKPSESWLEHLQATRLRVKTSLYPKDEDVNELTTLSKKGLMFVTRWGRFADNRCLYVTATGSVGLGPASMQVGDQIALVKGSELIFVMRELRGSHELVGETYLHGLSGEDGWDKRREKQIEIASLMGGFEDIYLQ